MERQKIAVVGSTGRTGRLVLKEGIRRGFAVTAFTRRPQLLEGMQGLEGVVQGDGRNAEDMVRAVAGQDAVVSIVSAEGLGPTTVISDVARAELAAMRAAGVRRLVFVSASALEGSHPFLLVNIVRWLLRKPYADFRRMETILAQSGADWTVVRPPRLTNGPATGKVRWVSGKGDFDRRPYTISRADLANALLDLAADSKFVGQTVLVSRAGRHRSS